jgi:hypothetical protein
MCVRSATLLCLSLAACYRQYTRVVVADAGRVSAKTTGVEPVTLAPTGDELVATAVRANFYGERIGHIPVSNDHPARAVLAGQTVEVVGEPRDTLRFEGDTLHVDYRFGLERDCSRHEHGLVLVGHCEDPTYRVDLATELSNVSDLRSVRRKDPMPRRGRVLLGVLAGLFMLDGAVLIHDASHHTAGTAALRGAGSAMFVIGLGIAGGLTWDWQAADVSTTALAYH